MLFWLCFKIKFLYLVLLLCFIALSRVIPHFVGVDSYSLIWYLRVLMLDLIVKINESFDVGVVYYGHLILINSFEKRT